MSRTRPRSPAEIADLDSFNEVVLDQLSITAQIYNLDAPEDITLNSEYFTLIKKFEANTLLLIKKAKELTLLEDDFVTVGIYKYLNAYLQYLEDFRCQIQNSAKFRGPAKIATFNNNLAQIIEFFRLLKLCAPKDFKQEYHRPLENLKSFIKIAQDHNRALIYNMINAIKDNAIEDLQKLLLDSPAIIHKPCSHILSEMEMGFNPGLLTAKYSQSSAMFSNGIFANSIEKDKKKYLLSCPVKNKEFKNYNTLMVAAHWGSANMFNYLLTEMKPDSPEKIFAVLKALCAPYFKNNVNVKWLASHLDFYGGINDEDAEFSNEFPKFLDFTDCTRQKFALIAALIQNSINNGMLFPEYTLTEYDTNTEVEKYNKKIKGVAQIIPEMEILPAITIKHKR